MARFDTRKYTFVEIKGTRSCIRLHGMGVPVTTTVQIILLLKENIAVEH